MTPTTVTTTPGGSGGGGGGGTAIPGQSGYWMLGSDGTVYAFGDAKSLR